jgi:transcriptional regulator with XRE-family HTH domain
MAIDPVVWEQPDMRRALAARNIGAVYRVLRDVGISQRQIAALTGQSQSEVSEIFKGRQVKAYDVLERIAEGLGIPREYLGLSWRAADGTYCGEGPVAELPEGVNAEMLRRHLLAFGAATVFGGPIQGLGELAAQLPHPGVVPLPSQLFPVHVEHVRDLTRDLRAMLLDHGSNPEMSSGAAAWADQLLGVPGPDTLTRKLRTAVAELHILVAGWAGLDAGLYDRALYHYSRGLELATDTREVYLQSIALACAGLAMLDQGHPRQAAKMLQFAQVKSWSIPPEYDRRMVEACAQADSVIALIGLGETRAAVTELAKSRQLWQPTRTDPRGDQDYVAARLEISRGRLDAAEPFAVASVARWDGISKLRRAHSTVLLATIHVQAGEPAGLSMAHRAITDVAKLSSVQARTRLHPLAEALEGRPGSDAQELVRMGRQVATARV